MFNYGQIGKTPFLFETSSQIIMAAVDCAGTAFALHEIVSMLGLNFITTDIAANSIADNQSQVLLYVFE